MSRFEIPKRWVAPTQPPDGMDPDKVTPIEFPPKSGVWAWYTVEERQEMRRLIDNEPPHEPGCATEAAHEFLPAPDDRPTTCPCCKVRNDLNFRHEYKAFFEGSLSDFVDPPPPEPPLMPHDPAAGRAAGRRARDKAMQRVDQASDLGEKRKIDAAILRVRGVMADFIADNVWDDLGDDFSARENRVMGPRLTAAARAGHIEKVPGVFRQGHRGVNHARPQQVWRTT